MESVGEKKVEKARITVWDYEREHLEHNEVPVAEECFPYRDTQRASWIDVDGLHEIDLLQKIGEMPVSSLAAMIAAVAILAIGVWTIRRNALGVRFQPRGESQSREES